MVSKIIICQLSNCLTKKNLHCNFPTASFTLQPENRIFTWKYSPGSSENNFSLRILDFGYKKHKIKDVVIMAKNGPPLLARWEIREKIWEKNTRDNFLYKTVWTSGYFWYAYKVKLDLMLNLGLKNRLQMMKPENRIFTRKYSPGSSEKNFPLRILDFGYKKA